LILLTFNLKGVDRLGWLLDDGQTVLSSDPEDTNMPQSIMDLIKRGPYARNQLTSSKTTLESFNLEDLKLLEPIVPSGIFCVDSNYSDPSTAETLERPAYPSLFWRLPRNHVAHGQPLLVPTSSNTLDWAGELVAVIGKRGRHIETDHALHHVFGYSIYNQGSVREFQGHTSQFGLGNNFHASGAFGPVIVTADEFGDPYQHEIQTHLNGEQVQNASISSMLHRIEDVIAYISSSTELQSGDILCTGTPGGVGADMQPPRYLRDGEIIEVRISGIGTLSNPVEAEPTDLNAVACSC
jgi:2-keto-4-pentenoate hydratase/2-oxohepta-3-ene-1,7-dioic acid hydratase in catechol pathway